MRRGAWIECYGLPLESTLQLEADFRCPFVFNAALEKPSMSLMYRLKTLLRVARSTNRVSVSDALPVKMEFEPGHFYSAIPSTSDIESHFWKLDSKSSSSLPGVNLNLDVQARWLELVAESYQRCTFESEEKEGHRYYFNNPYFRFLDGIFLYGIMSHLRPKRIVEIGSGYSSAEMLDINDIHLNRSVELSFIDPFPERLRSLLRKQDLSNVRIYENRVQDVVERPWQHLQSGDILFIDSSHVSKCGSDVNFIFFEILPTLSPGVMVHIHDIFPKFEYPRSWLQLGRSWSEAYILRAFLIGNQDFEIIAWVPLLVEKFPELIHRKLPICEKDSGGSFWMQKKALKAHDYS